MIEPRRSRRNIRLDQGRAAVQDLPMRKILVIGIGAGDPDYLTVQAIDALNRAQIFFIPDKGEQKAGLNHVRSGILERFVKNPNYRLLPFAVPDRRRTRDNGEYPETIQDWHARLEALYETLFAALDEDGCGAFLVWGDPAIYDGTLRVLDRLRAKGLSFTQEVVPGISAIQALAAKHGIALNRIGEGVLITTGRRLVEEGFPAGADSVVVMLDSELAFRNLRGQDFHIWWGAYLGTPDEILLAGRLDQIADEIAQVRQEARERHGWLMDTYLLRRKGG